MNTPSTDELQSQIRAAIGWANPEHRIRDVEALIADRERAARINEIKWLQKNAPMYISGFSTEHLEGKDVKKRLKYLQAELEQKDGHD